MNRELKDIKFRVRGIEVGDLKKGLLTTLSNLSELGKIESDSERAEKILKIINANPFHKIFVAAEDISAEIIGTTTLLIEQKVIHDGGKAGHIEDVATRKGYEGLGVGSALISHALQYAESAGCYKVVLDCSESNVRFYQKNGFRIHETSMRYDISS